MKHSVTLFSYHTQFGVKHNFINSTGSNALKHGLKYKNIQGDVHASELGVEFKLNVDENGEYIQSISTLNFFSLQI